MKRLTPQQLLGYSSFMLVLLAGTFMEYIAQLITGKHDWTVFVLITVYVALIILYTRRTIRYIKEIDKPEATPPESNTP